jgi:hypothetical protein
MVALLPSVDAFNVFNHSKENLLKQSLLVASLLAAFALSAQATSNHGAPLGTVKVTGSGSNQVTSSSAAGAFVSGAGSSLSKASNVQSATAYVGGSGSLSSKPGNAFVSIEDCVDPVKVKGTRLTGTATSFGGVSVAGKSTASNVSTGTGTGGAEAAGRSFAEVAGKTTVTSPNINLTAEGEAYGGVLTRATAGKNETDLSQGSTSAAFKSTASGSLLTFNHGGVVGDVKSANTNVYTRSGDLTCPPGKCSPGTTTTTIARNATVEAGATGNAFADVKATFVRP